MSNTKETFNDKHHNLESALALFDEDDVVTAEYTEPMQDKIRGVTSKIRERFKDLCKSRYQPLTPPQVEVLHELLKGALVVDDRTEIWTYDIEKLVTTAIWVNSLGGQLISE